MERTFWSKYANFIVKRNISGQAGAWYIRQAQRFVYGLKNVRLRDVDDAYLMCYFDELGRYDNLNMTA